MTTIAELGETMQTLFTTTANQRAKKQALYSGQRVVTGAGFAQALVFSFMASARSTRTE